MLRIAPAPPAARPTRRPRPRSMNTTRFATSRAKPSSCVTTIIVMPERGEVAHHVQHLADELRIERRGRLVEQHQLRAASPARGRWRRAAAGRRRVRPDRRRACRRGPTRSSSAIASVDGLGARRFCTVTGPSMMFCERRQVSEQVEALEHHAAEQPLPRELARRDSSCSASPARRKPISSPSTQIAPRRRARAG